MDLRNRAVVVMLALALLLVFAPGALAFEEENQPDPDACMGPTDPFCPLPPGSGSGDWPPQYVPQCYACDLDFTDPLNMGGTAYYACILVDPMVRNGYSNCRDGSRSSYCQFSTSFCQVA